MKLHPGSKIVVVGGGYGGLAAAAALRRHSGAEVTLLESRSELGRCASGKNAGMIRELVSEEALRSLARSSLGHLDDRTEAVMAARFRPTGSLLFGKRSRLERLREGAENRARFVDPQFVADRAPDWHCLPHEDVLFCPHDGIVAPRGLLSYLETEALTAGVKIQRGKAQGLLVADRRIEGIRTENGEIKADLVVNAAGVHADDWLTASGLAPLGLRRTRRHLFVLDAPVPIDDHRPFTWDLECDFYVRPWRKDDGRCALLFTPGDDHPIQGEAEIDLGDVRDLLAREWPKRMGGVLPDLKSMEHWVGVRCFSPDGLFVLGPDTRVDGLVWVAALGGHGASAALALGDALWSLLQDESKNDMSAFRPQRFANEGIRT